MIDGGCSRRGLLASIVTIGVSLGGGCLRSSGPAAEGGPTTDQPATETTQTPTPTQTSPPPTSKTPASTINTPWTANYLSFVNGIYETTVDSPIRLRVRQPNSPSYLFFGDGDEPFFRLYQLWDGNGDQAVIFTFHPENAGRSDPLFTSSRDRVEDVTDAIDAATYDRIGTQRSIPAPPMPTGKYPLRLSPTDFHQVEDGELSVPSEDFAVLTVSE